VRRQALTRIRTWLASSQRSSGSSPAFRLPSGSTRGGRNKRGWAERDKERERLRRVAVLLGEELAQATKTLDGLSMLPAGIRPPFIGFHVWAALSASGELRGLSAEPAREACRRLSPDRSHSRGPAGHLHDLERTDRDYGRDRGDRRERLPPFVDLTNNLVEMREFAKVAVRSAVEALEAADAPAAAK